MARLGRAQPFPPRITRPPRVTPFFVNPVGRARAVHIWHRPILLSPRLRTLPIVGAAIVVEVVDVPRQGLAYGRIPIVTRGYDPILLAAPEAGLLRDLQRTGAATEKRLRS